MTPPSPSDSYCTSTTSQLHTHTPTCRVKPANKVIFVHTSTTFTFPLRPVLLCPVQRHHNYVTHLARLTMSEKKDPTSVHVNDLHLKKNPPPHPPPPLTVQWRLVLAAILAARFADVSALLAMRTAPCLPSIRVSGSAGHLVETCSFIALPYLDSRKIIDMGKLGG